jgi:hypothetical protein
MGMFLPARAALVAISIVFWLLRKWHARLVSNLQVDRAQSEMNDSSNAANDRSCACIAR